MVLAYGDGGCRSEWARAEGPGSSACVLVACAPGARRARLLQATARYWPRITAPQAEACAAAMATRALCQRAREAMMGPAFVPDVWGGVEIEPSLIHLREECVYQGVGVVGSFIRFAYNTYI